MPFTHASIEIEDLLTEAERKHIIEAFRLFDVNGNGTLDHEELVCRISSLAHVQISPPLKEEFLGILKWRTIFPLWMPIIVILCWQRCAGYALGFGGDNFEKISVEVNSFISILFLVHTCRTSVKYARVKNQSIPTLYRVFCQQRIKLCGESVNFQCCCMRLSGPLSFTYNFKTSLIWFPAQAWQHFQEPSTHNILHCPARKFHLQTNLYTEYFIIHYFLFEIELFEC